MERISVIVPIYKVEAYLDKCVQSIVDQTYTNLEIILVDDGSPDRCGQMCDAWAEKDSRIRVIHKENGGLSDARNAGLEIATGTYIAFVDSDDWVSVEYISSMYRAIQETGAQIAGCGICTVFDGQEPDEGTGTGELCIYSSEEAIGALLQGQGLRAVAWNKLYHKSLLEGERYPVGKHHEDEFFTYRIFEKADRLVCVDERLYFYLQRQGSIMRSFSIKRLDALDAYLERLQFLEKRYPNLYRKDKFTFCFSCAMMYCKAQKLDNCPAKAIKQRIKSLRKQVSISCREYRAATWKQRMYAMGTGCGIGLFCWIMNLRGQGGEKDV